MTDTTDAINRYLTMIGRIEKRKGVSFLVLDEPGEIPESTWAGIDWAKGSGMTRGDVISRNDNIIEVRFRTVQ